MLSVFDMLKYDEGIKYKSYKDTKGNVTTGIGFNMDNPSAKKTWIRADIPESFTAVYASQAIISTNSITKLLNTCVDSCRVDLESIFEEFNDFPDYVQLALINLMFNLGLPRFSKFTDFISLIEEHDYDEAEVDLANTLWSRQLINRSKRVCALLKGDYSSYKA